MNEEKTLEEQVKDLQKRAEADEAKVGQDEAGIKRIGEIVKEFDKTQYVYVKQLRANIPYKPLAFGAYLEIRNTKDNIDLGTEMLFRMLKAADKTVTMEQIKKIPIDIITEMLALMTGTKNVKGFLPQTKE